MENTGEQHVEIASIGFKLSLIVQRTFQKTQIIQIDQSSGHTMLTELTIVKLPVRVLFSNVCVFQANRKIIQDMCKLLHCV